MDWREIVRTHLTEITGDPARDEEIVDELAQHLALRFDDARRAGATAEDAVAMAAGELRNSAQIRRAILDADRARPAAPVPPPARTQLLADLWRDVRYAARLLRRNPRFTIAALLTMTLGIGMTTTIFSVVQAVLLRPVPLPEADRLLMVWGTDRNTGTVREPASLPDFVDFSERSRRIDRFGGFGSYDANLNPASGDPIRVSALAVTRGFIELLGVAPSAGRVFAEDEFRLRGPAVVLISERLWTTLFNRQPSAIGSTLRLNDRVLTVIGVIPAAADFGVLQMLSSADNGRGFADRDARTRVDLFTPVQADARTAARDAHGLLMIGRLALGATVASAQEDLSRIASELERAYLSNRARGVFVEPLQAVIFGRVRAPLAVLMAAVVLVLLISWVNLANLLLARGASRVREIAVRAALGAEMPRLLRQFAVENTLLMLLAAVLGVGFAYGTLNALVATAPAEIPRLGDVSLDVRVLLVTLGVSVCVGIAFGLFPMTQVRGNTSQSMLNAEDGRGATSRNEGRLRAGLVVVEVATAVVLLTGAGLLIRSFWMIQRTNPGFDASGVLKAEFQLPSARYPVDFRTAAPGYVAFNRFKDALVQRVTELPGVEAAALAGQHPLGAGTTTGFAVVGRDAEAQSWPELPVRSVTPGYFAVLRVPLVRGRVLSETDTATSVRAVVVNQALAERFFPNEDPIGQRLIFFGPTEWTIVGIVGNERFDGITNAAPIAAYALLTQAPASTPALLVRTTAGDPATMAPALRAAIRDIDPALAVFAMEPLAETLANSLAQQRFLMLLLGLFAALSVTLAAIGVHGVLSYVVAQRAREIGVRMSLGADGRHVVWLVVSQGVTLTAWGLATGVGLALASSRWLAGLLFEITPTDAPTLGAVVITIGVVAAVATWLPARRAVGIDPVTALRQG